MSGIAHALLCVAMIAGNLGVAGVANAQTAPVGQGFQLNESDVRTILQQIDIAERHAAGVDGTPGTADDPTHATPRCQTLLGPDADQIPNQTNQGVELPLGLRSVDGTCNNLLSGTDPSGKSYSKYGAADQVFPRKTPAEFRDAENLFFDPDGPGPLAAGDPTSYKQKRGIVVDSQPRVISNLIVDQSPNNPAAVAAANPDPAAPPATPDESGTLFIPNVATDVGLSAPFNSWFTLFGQFFDHGLDLVTKGGGTVLVPLQPDDPLIAGDDGILGNGDDLPENQRFIPLTRATNQPGPDGVLGTSDDVQEHTNTTTPFVDQNQTYTSHPSHQVFLRQYENSTGVPLPDGKMLDAPGPDGIRGDDSTTTDVDESADDGGMGDWNEVKGQAAEMLGIELRDSDVLNVPLLKTDPYGHFVPGANGYPQLVMGRGADGIAGTPDDVSVEGDPLAPISTVGAVRTGHAFLDDIAHFANPVGDHDGDPSTPPQGLLADDDTAIGAVDGPPPPQGRYDDELLGVHFVTGDGRGNENIGLTAVHTVFHAEHNRLVGHIESVINATGDQAFIDAWHRTNGAARWTYGERLFQAARFVTEMEYQHLVFEEFARKVQPMVNLFGEGGVGYHTRIDPAIVAEFAHAVYRFGHSMLTETVARTNPDGTKNDIPLLRAFLNPVAFDNGGTQDAGAAAGSIAQGMTRQVANEIDEFVTNALRNRLLGLPLDLPTINMTRARDTGIARLNAARRTFFAESGDSQVAPYQSWADFSFNLKHPESLENFIAAYGTHPTITAASSVADKRAAAHAILVAAGDPASPDHADSVAFLNSTNGPVRDYSSLANGATTTGVDDIDFWVGGLAEKRMVFGGLLGSSFNYIFERQMENLQDADRFYYLSRTAGMNLLTQLEGNSFAELTMRNTDAEALPADAFSRPALVFNLNRVVAADGSLQDDPTTTEYNEAALLIRMPDGTIRYTGPEHSVWNGTEVADRMWSSEGDDTLRGNDGADWMQGGDGLDNHIGGDGDDIMQDSFGDDVLKGGNGDDALSSGAGFGGDLNQGGFGSDFIVGGNDITETFGGPDNDFVFAGDSEDTVFGDDGNDWIEGGTGPFNLLQGDNGAPFADDPRGGHDVVDGDGGEQDYDMEGGDDIGTLGPGIQRVEGMLGFDWATHKGDPEKGDSDMNFTAGLPPSLDNNRDRLDLVEALSGWDQDDVLRGDDRVAADMAGHELTAAGIGRIAGLQDVVGAGVTSFSAGNIIMGGAGNDLIEGRGGDDIIDGDKWLNVQIEGSGGERQDSMSAFRARIFDGTLDPGTLSIVRTIETATPAAGNLDIAVFSDVVANYTVTPNEDGTVTVVHGGGTQADGTDTLRNVETLRFADQDISVPTAPEPATATEPGAPVIGDALRGARGGALTAIAQWDLPASDGGSPITGYVVTALRMSGGGAKATVLDRTNSPVLLAGARSHEMTLSAGVYRFQVRAVNVIGTGPASARSDTVQPR